MSFVAELKRRNVLRVGAAYLVASWLLIQVVETIFPAFGFGHAAVRTITIVCAAGFIPALVLAWAFELTPEGLKWDRDVDRIEPGASQARKPLDRWIMAGLALALGYFALDKFLLAPQRDITRQEQQAARLVAATDEARQAGRSEALVESYGDRSIAVLPFINLSDDSGNEYFSDGIAEEILTLLAQLPELRVISRASAFSYKGRNARPADVARELNVAHILDGSVRKAGSRVRISTRLIDARADSHMWSATYDRNLDDIFAIQDEIAATVVAQLRITLLGEMPRSETTDPESYAAFLQARHLTRQGTVDGLREARRRFEQVLVADPHYVAAMHGLTSAYMSEVIRGLRPAGEGYALARELVERILSIDPDNAAAHARLGTIALYADRDLASAASHMQRAVELDPASTLVIADAAGILAGLARLEEATALQEYVNVRDPVNPIGHNNLGLNYLEMGRWDDAIAAFETTLRLSPGYVGGHWGIGLARLLQGDPPASLEAMQQEPGDVLRLAGLAIAQHALGQAEESEAALEELIGQHGDSGAYHLACALAYRGDIDRAFFWLKRAVQGESPGLAEIATEKLLENLHEDPRWMSLLESIGRSPEQREAIEFVVSLPN
jgi:adenylate cyclase